MKIRNKKSFTSLTIFAVLLTIFLILPIASCITSCSSKETAISINADSYKSQITNSGEVSFPNYNGFVNDYTNTLGKDWENKIERLVSNVEKETGSEIAVAVIEDLQGLTIEEYAVKLFNKWGIGKENQDNGILLLVAMNERKLRIEVGYGLEGVITDLEAKEIIDNVIVPRFKENNYKSGIYNGVVAIANKIYSEQGKAELTYSDTAENTAKTSASGSVVIAVIIILANFLPWVIIGGFFGISFWITYIKNHKCPRCHKLGLTIKQTIIEAETYEYPGKMIIKKLCRYCGFYTEKIITIPKLSRHYYSGRKSSTSFSSSHSSSSNSSGSHSSSSFGGGSSGGGGGASGSW